MLLSAIVGLALSVGPAWRAEAPTQTARIAYDNHTSLSDRAVLVSRSASMRTRIIMFASSRYDARNAKAFVEIIWRESRFNYRAVNDSSGAYGLGQALPGSKMESVGDDWRTNPYTQLLWVVKYIESRYGSPVEALSWHDRKGWY